MKTYFRTMTDKQMKDLARIRIKNVPDKTYSISNATIEDIEIESKYSINNPYGISVIVHTKEYAPERINIHLDKFYLNEVIYMIKEKIVVF